jgi:hypothetical protein
MPDSPSSATPATTEDKVWKFLAQSFAGQAAVFLTVVGGGAYIAGVLVLGLKLEFRDFSWISVLGQFPQDLVFFTALGYVILPSLIFGSFCSVVLVTPKIYEKPCRFLSSAYANPRLTVRAASISVAETLLLVTRRRLTSPFTTLQKVQLPTDTS